MFGFFEAKKDLFGNDYVARRIELYVIKKIF